MSDEFETRARAAAYAIAVFRTGYVDERFVADATTIIAREIEAACAEATARADRLSEDNIRLAAMVADDNEVLHDRVPTIGPVVGRAAKSARAKGGA
jgi:hypothetical protein